MKIQASSIDSEHLSLRIKNEIISFDHDT
ncbi:hypothetical protein D046_5892A, partial [Vibrio parahaemolyticus V-223/04]